MTSTGFEHVGAAAGTAGGLSPVVLKSVLLRRIGVPHGFTTRIGGVSSGAFSSLNFGNPGELPPERRDPPGNIAENQRRVLAAISAAGREIAEVWQVHGAAVDVRCRGQRRESTGPGAAGSDCKADAIVTDEPRCVAGVRVADCAPVLLASGDGRVVAAVHAGWRGVIGGVLPAAVAAMRDLGAQEIAGAIGPCIGVEAFEVGEEVASEFDRVFDQATGVVRREAGRKPHVDLKRALGLQLSGAGLDAGCVETLPHCTVRDRELFFSHRRDAGMTGRMIAVVGAR